VISRHRGKQNVTFSKKLAINQTLSSTETATTFFHSKFQ